MAAYEFTIVLSDRSAFGESSVLEVADRLFPYFRGDVNPAIAAGRPVVDCTIEAVSLEAAIRDVLHGLNSEGLRAARVELEPESLTST